MTFSNTLHDLLEHSMCSTCVIYFHFTLGKVLNANEAMEYFMLLYSTILTNARYYQINVC